MSYFHLKNLMDKLDGQSLHRKYTLHTLQYYREYPHMHFRALQNTRYTRCSINAWWATEWLIDWSINPGLSGENHNLWGPPLIFKSEIKSWTWRPQLLSQNMKQLSISKMPGEMRKSGDVEGPDSRASVELTMWPPVLLQSPQESL